MAKWMEAIIEANKAEGIEMGKKDIYKATPLKLIATANPKKPGTQAWARFEAYFKAKPETIGDAFDAGLRQDDIRHDSDKGFIVLGDAVTEIEEAAKVETPGTDEFEIAMRHLV